MVEFGLVGKAGVDHPGAAGAERARDQLGQPVVRLRAEDEIDIGRPAADLGAFGLGDAAGDRDQHRTSAARLAQL